MVIRSESRMAHAAWDSIETATIGKTHPTLIRNKPSESFDFESWWSGTSDGNQHVFSKVLQSNPWKRTFSVTIINNQISPPESTSAVPRPLWIDILAEC